MDYKHQYESMKKMVTMYQDEIVPGLWEKIKELEKQMPKWIPVSERLPKGANGKSLCEVVIAYLDCGEVSPQVCVGWLNIDKWYLVVDEDDYYTIWGFEAVTHWMPLPEPPKENDNG